MGPLNNHTINKQANSIYIKLYANNDYVTIIV